MSRSSARRWTSVAIRAGAGAVAISRLAGAARAAAPVAPDESVDASISVVIPARDEADRIGLSVGDGEVRKHILGIEAFQGIDGKFDRFKSTLQPPPSCPTTKSGAVTTGASPSKTAPGFGL